MIAKLNAFLGKFVGPNAAHAIDGVIGVAIGAAITLTYSAPARLFFLHHSRLGLIVGLVVVPVATALAAKFRKAAGSQVNLVDEITKSIEDALKTQPRRPPV